MGYKKKRIFSKKKKFQSVWKKNDFFKSAVRKVKYNKNNLHDSKKKMDLINIFDIGI
jgi:hypothetical protein